LEFYNIFGDRDSKLSPLFIAVDSCNQRHDANFSLHIYIIFDRKIFITVNIDIIIGLKIDIQLRGIPGTRQDPRGIPLPHEEAIEMLAGKQEKTFVGNGGHSWETVGQPGALIVERCQRCGIEFDPAIRGQRERAEAQPCFSHTSAA